MANHYDVPSWAGKAPTGHHLDVTKDDKLIQKLMIDDKKCYLFGRNPHLNDFCIDHGSCSRVHAALVYHKHLNISYLVDLGSTHGTFIGNLRIDGHKPTQLHVDTTFHFGASTRYYVLRERPSAASAGAGGRNSILEDIPMLTGADGLASGGDGAALLGLPESQTELDNLTEYNTAHNRRISMLGITDDTAATMAKAARASRNPNKRNRHVTFNDEEIVINPEDIDPTVGRFRNLVKTSVVIPTAAKRMRFDHGAGSASVSSTTNPYSGLLHQDFVRPAVPPLSSGVGSSGGAAAAASGGAYLSHHLYEDLPPSVRDGAAEHHHHHHQQHGLGSSAGRHAANAGPGSSDLNAKFGIMLPNPAPEVSPLVDDEGAGSRRDAEAEAAEAAAEAAAAGHLDDLNSIDDDNSDEPRKKKYAKEAWPGRKPLLSTF